METVELSQQQGARMAELPEDQQNGRLTVATIAARPRLAAASPISD